MQGLKKGPTKLVNATLTKQRTHTETQKEDNNEAEEGCQETLKKRKSGGKPQEESLL